MARLTTSALSWTPAILKRRGVAPGEVVRVSPPDGRVLQIFQPPIGGVPAYIDRLASGLRDLGWQVTAMHLPIRRGLDAKDLRTIRAVARKARGMDLIHAHSSKASVIGGVAGRAARVPCVYTPHGWAFVMRTSGAARVAYASVEAVMARAFHRRVITVSNFERDSARRWHIAPNRKLEMVHTGLPDPGPTKAREVARRDLGIPPSATVAVWVGRHQAAKQPELLAPLASALKGTATVVAAGQDLAGSPEGDAFVRAGGRLVPEGTAAEAVYAAADVCVQTSAWEAFPLVPLEAMQRGLPVVSFAVGGVPEQIDDGRTGFLVEPDDIGALVARVAELANDVAKREAMGRAAAEDMRTRFSFARMCEEIDRTYRTTLDRRG